MRRLSLLFGLVPVLGLVELGLHQYFAGRAPDFRDYAALAPQLLELKEPGVPVVVAPSWAEPLLRQAAPAAFPIAELARSDDRAFGGFLEVSLLGEHAPELAGFPISHSQEIGRFMVSRRDNPQPEPSLFDFVTALDADEAEVFTEVDGQRVACPLQTRPNGTTGGLPGHVAYPKRRHECSGGRIVAVTLVEDEAYRPRRCIMAQLPANGSVVLSFNGVTTSTRLVGFAGFSYLLERDAIVEQVELGVSESGQALGQHRAAGAQGWARFELSRSAPSGTVEVTLRRLARSASDFCFALEAR